MFNFGLSEEQVMLRKTVKNFLEDRCSTEFVRRIMEEPSGYCPQLWQDMSRLGWLGLNVPEEYDGSGMGFIDLVLVMEQMGKAVLPAPFLETVMASEAILQGGTEVQKLEYLPKVANGELIATLAIDEPEGFWGAEAITAQAVFEGNSCRLTGVKLFVPYAQIAGLIVCAVRTGEGTRAEEGVTLVLLDPHAEGVTINQLITMDEAYRLCELKLDGVQVPASRILGEAGQGWSILDRVRQKAAVLSSADAVGGAEKAMEMIVEYSKERQQFDKLIGSFQAIKHRCADMLVDVESSRAVLYYAAWALEHEAIDAELAVSSAKAYASDTYVKATQKALQSFGGIGFTWEHDIHLFLKRARRLEMAFGDASFHRERIAGLWL